MSIHLQKSTSIRPRTSPRKFSYVRIHKDAREKKGSDVRISYSWIAIKKSRCISAGAVDAVRAAMKNHPGDLAVQDAATAALSKLGEPPAELIFLETTQMGLPDSRPVTAASLKLANQRKAMFFRTPC